MTAAAWAITVTDAPDKEARAVIENGLAGYNKEQAGRSVVLYTISFQAPGFYERLGYRRFGTLDCDPPGTSRIFFVKELGTESTA